MAGRFEFIWYEDEQGNHVPHDPNKFEHPEGAAYHISRFPTQLTTTYRRLNEDGSSSKVCEMTAGYQPDLVLAFCRPSLRNRFNQLRWYGSLAQVYEFDMAVFLAAETCERCMNALAHRHGLAWGYREFSDEWHACGTTCQRCQHLGRGKFWSQNPDGSWSVAEEARKIRDKGLEEIKAFLAKAVGAENIIDDPLDFLEKQRRRLKEYLH
jgi:hypothetical protein